MSVGLLLITHNRIGAEMLETATRMLGSCPLTAIALSVTICDDPDQLLEQAQTCVDRLDEGDGVLVLTDLFGSTPSNIANTLAANAMGRPQQVQVLSGVNLPMLVRILNYHQLSLGEMAEKGLAGGRDAVMSCTIGTS
jgi:PTS system ascorbate-specific IIA component